MALENGRQYVVWLMGEFYYIASLQNVEKGIMLYISTFLAPGTITRILNNKIKEINKQK